MPEKARRNLRRSRRKGRRELLLGLLGGVVRRRPLTGEEALAALNSLERRAAEGDPKSQTEFARYLLTDAPDARRNRRALLLLKKAAASGLPEAIRLLGIVYMRGQGLSADRRKGRSCCTGRPCSAPREPPLNMPAAAPKASGGMPPTGTPSIGCASPPRRAAPKRPMPRDFSAATAGARRKISSKPPNG
ncbi:MAG: hypothetical protein ACFWTZ_06860 [Burkholderia sp.]|jgi:hypothetical protein